MRTAGDVRVRFMAKVRVTDSGCWEWTARIDTNGYGAFRMPGGRMTAHRAAYLLFTGPIPEGRQLDHLCRVRHCVNPGHLEPVTSRQNTLRGQTLAAANIAKTHCTNGHPFDEKNTRYRSNGNRVCRSCSAAAERRRWATRVTSKA